MTRVKNTPATSNGSKIKATIKAAAPKQAKKAHKAPGGFHLLTSDAEGFTMQRIAGFTPSPEVAGAPALQRPLAWFVNQVGRVVFAYPDSLANVLSRYPIEWAGFVPVTDEAHAGKLNAAQRAYRFTTAETGEGMVSEWKAREAAMVDPIPANPYPFPAATYRARKYITDEQVAALTPWNMLPFEDHIGAIMYALHPTAYNGPVLVEDQDHARHLCEVAQAHGYRFVFPDYTTGPDELERKAAQIVRDLIAYEEEEAELQELESLTLPELREEVGRAIDQYLEADTHGSKVEDLLIRMLGGSEWESNAWHYGEAFTRLLCALAKPEVSLSLRSEMRSGHYSDLLDMLPRMIEFFGSLQTDMAACARMLRNDLHNVGTGKDEGQNREHLTGYIKEFREKARLHREGMGRVLIA